MADKRRRAIRCGMRMGDQLFTDGHYSGMMNNIVAEEVCGSIFEDGLNKNKDG